MSEREDAAKWKLMNEELARLRAENEKLRGNMRELIRRVQGGMAVIETTLGGDSA